MKRSKLLRATAGDDLGGAGKVRTAVPQVDPLSPKRPLIPWRSQVFLNVLSVVGLFVVWEILGRWVVTNDAFLVPVSAVFADLWQWISSGEILAPLGASAKTFAVGFGFALVVGLVVGIAMGLSRTVWGLFNPLVAGLTATPTLALTPLFIIWFGIGLTSKVVMIAFISSFLIIINTATGMRGVDQGQLDAARAFGASTLQLILKVRLPSALPVIIAGLRLAMSNALVAIFVVELFGGLEGIGYSIATAATVFDTERVFAGIFVLAGFGILFTVTLVWLEQRVAPWRVESER